MKILIVPHEFTVTNVKAMSFWTLGRANRGPINLVLSIRPRHVFLENASFSFSET